MINRKCANNEDMADKIYEFCKEYIFAHGYAPSYKEIGEGVGLSSIASVNWQMKKLFQDGRLSTDLTDQRCGRGYRISGYKIVSLGHNE